jgi:hypothetical protein
MPEASCDLTSSAHVTVDAAYLETNQPVVRRQLQKAGVRLAHSRHGVRKSIAKSRDRTSQIRSYDIRL